MSAPAPATDDMKPAETPRHPRSGPAAVVRAGRWLVLVTVILTGLVLAAYSVAAAYYLRSLRVPSTIPGLKVAGAPVSGVAFAELPSLLLRIAEPALDEAVVLSVGTDRVRATRREIGLSVDLPALTARARRAGRSGNPLLDVHARRSALRGGVDLEIPFALDRGRALEFLSDLKEQLDRAPVDAHLDLEHHGLAPDRPGHLLMAYESLVPLAELARTAATQASLPVVEVPARSRSGDLAAIDISTVLGTWETRYSTAAIDSDRTYNLKVGAGKLDGYIIKPHESFSFNEAVGERTEKQGYRVAPVISAGELIDGLAGGMCQIASTLHAAAFFAGFDIVSTTPHSRPSTYIPLGLDSTVVWPSTDLKLRNPFDFPVVVHFSVSQGAVKVELLGKRRVYKVVFEREIEEEHGFPSSMRKDKEWPTGQHYVAQEGYPGYHAQRRRYLFDANAELPRSLGSAEVPLARVLARVKLEPVRMDKWSIHYPATEEITVVGAGPKSRKKREPPPSHHIPAVPKDQIPIGKIVR